MPGKSKRIESIKKKDVQKAISGSFGVKLRVYGKMAIDPTTLERLFKKWPDLLDELESEKQVGNDFVDNAMYKRIGEGSDAMIIWYQKSIMGRSEKSQLELTGKDGGPINNKITIEIVDAKPEDENP